MGCGVPHGGPGGSRRSRGLLVPGGGVRNIDVDIVLQCAVNRSREVTYH
jgi:hypothetical protein